MTTAFVTESTVESIALSQLDTLVKRKILLEWLERTLVDPQRVEPHGTDPILEHRLDVIPERGNRVLRVIVNRSVDPMRTVTLFFDRKMRGKL